MMNKLNLQNRLILVTVLLTLLVTVSLDVAGVYIIKQYMLSRYKERITFLSKYLAVNSEVGVLIRDRTGLNSLAVNLLGEEDVISVTILDSKNNVLVRQSRGKIPGVVKTVETMVKLNKTNDENILFKEYSNTPFGTLRIPGVETIGKVRIEYATRGISLLIKEVTTRFIMVSLSIMLIAIILFYFITKTVVEDVSKLASVSRKVGAGEMNLRAHLGTLPETRELAFAFNSMLDSLDESRKAYERMTQEAAHENYLAELGKFSLSVAHEVKNPLAIIKTSSEMLKKEFKVPCDHPMGRYVDDEIHRLNRLIEDFLLFAKPGHIVFENMDTAVFMQELERRFNILYGDEDLILSFDIACEDVKIRGDHTLLVRVIDNIVKNAVEESPSGGRVSVQAGRKGKLWKLTVADQGRGIKKGDEGRLFEPFFTTKSKGTGLGLSLAYQIVKTHNGVLQAENLPDQGAVFTISIPMID